MSRHDYYWIITLLWYILYKITHDPIDLGISLIFLCFVAAYFYRDTKKQ